MPSIFDPLPSPLAARHSPLGDDAPQRLRRGAALALAATLTLGADRPGTIRETDETIKVRGRTIAVDVFAPEEPGPYPAVVLAHGAGGIGEGKRSSIHDLARRLARVGYVALVPHYFGRVPPDRKNGTKNARLYGVWVRNVADTVGYAARRPDVDPRRIGLLGASFGGGVVLSVAARDRRVAAVVEEFGVFPEWDGTDPTRLPPVLILHGDADRVVPVDEAYKLDRLLRDAAIPHELKIYPGAGHGFRGDDGEDAERRTLDFFDEHLKRGDREDR
jgi:carboxymethylenebutenolidase